VILNRGRRITHFELGSLLKIGNREGLGKDISILQMSWNIHNLKQLVKHLFPDKEHAPYA